MSASARPAAGASSHELPRLPFRFAVAAPGVNSRRDWVGLAKAAESLGYEALLVNDHLHQPLAALPALVAAAEATQTLRVGTYVLCLDLRNPTLLAKELATIDLLSGGRLEIGVGAGWLDRDYEQAGLPVPTPQERRERFEETFTLLRLLLTEPTVSFEGRYHTVSNAACVPRPVQQPGPPFLIGAARRRLLEFAAREADAISITPTAAVGGGLEGATADSYDQRLAWIRAAAGERLPSLRIDLVLWECMITPRPALVAESFAAALGLPVDDALAMPCVLIGSVDDVAEHLLERRERWGATMVTVPSDAMTAFAPVVSRLTGE